MKNQEKNILGALFSELREKREFWFKKKSDPHQINTAVYVALAEVESAVRKAMWRTKKPAPEE